MLVTVLARAVLLGGGPGSQPSVAAALGCAPRRRPLRRHRRPVRRRRPQCRVCQPRLARRITPPTMPQHRLECVRARRDQRARRPSTRLSADGSAMSRSLFTRQRAHCRRGGTGGPVRRRAPNVTIEAIAAVPGGPGCAAISSAAPLRARAAPASGSRASRTPRGSPRRPTLRSPPGARRIGGPAKLRVAAMRLAGTRPGSSGRSESGVSAALCALVVPAAAAGERVRDGTAASRGGERHARRGRRPADGLARHALERWCPASRGAAVTR